MTVTAPPNQPKHGAHRLLTYNIRKCLGLDLRRRPERILQVLDDSGADIVVLQEADRRLPPRPAALPHRLIEQHGWEAANLGGAGSLGWHGNAILTRGLTVEETGHLPLPGLEPRGAVWSVVSSRNGSVLIVGAHLGLLQSSRQSQFKSLERFRKELPDLPTLWAGDFNQWGDGKILDHAAPSMTMLPPKPSFPAARPIGPLDRIATDTRVRVLGHGVYRARPAHVASDHLPVWADFEI